MRIALVGTHGVLASYSGFETCAEQLGARLAERGHAVTVYNRAHHVRYAAPTYKGMRLVRVPGSATKHLDTFSHTAISLLHALAQGYDGLIVFIAGNALLCLILRLFDQARIVLNVDGLDWKRRKWGAFARRYILWSECLVTRLARITVTDPWRAQAYYRRAYGVETAFIPYVSDVMLHPPGKALMCDQTATCPTSRATLPRSRPAQERPFAGWDQLQGIVCIRALATAGRGSKRSPVLLLQRRGRALLLYATRFHQVNSQQRLTGGKLGS